MSESTKLRDLIAQRAFEAWMGEHAPGTDPVDYGPFPRTQGTGKSVWVCAAEAMLAQAGDLSKFVLTDESGYMELRYYAGGEDLYGEGELAGHVDGGDSLAKLVEKARAFQPSVGGAQ